MSIRQDSRQDLNKSKMIKYIHEAGSASEPSMSCAEKISPVLLLDAIPRLRRENGAGKAGEQTHIRTGNLHAYAIVPAAIAYSLVSASLS